MRHDTNARDRDALGAVLRQPTYEVIPIKGVEEAVADLPREVRLTVTSSPVHGVDRTVEVAGRLSGMGFRVTPHLAARFVTDRAHLTKIATRLGEYDIRDIFVIGGDRAEPLGEYASAAALLEALEADGMPFDEVGVAGYPERHPTIPDGDIIRALHAKSRHATYIASQLCFDPGAVQRWAGQLQHRGIALPVEVGVPGVTPLPRLMRVAAKIGVGESLRFMRKHGGLFRALAGQRGTYRPTALMEQLRPALADPASPISGFHIYTFNNVAPTERWRQRLLGKLASR